ncbi:MAG: tetratricopeptide repeat protein [Elusimicrobiota bacterium]
MSDSAAKAAARCVRKDRFLDALGLLAKDQGDPAAISIDFDQPSNEEEFLGSFLKGNWLHSHGANRDLIQYDRALGVVAGARRRSRDESAMLLLEGAIHCAFRRYAPAVFSLDRAVRLDRMNAGAYLWRFRAKSTPLILDLWRGNSAEGLGKRMADALEDLKKAGALSPDGIYPYLWQVYLYNEWDMELGFASKATRKYPSLGNAVRSMDCIRRGDYGRAFLEARRCVELFPSCGWAHSFVSGRHAKLGRLPEALSSMNRALRLSPNEGKLYAWRGETRRRLGDYREALSDLTRAAELEPYNDNIFIWLGRMKLILGRHAEAVRDLTRALRLRERIPQKVYALRGEARFKSGDFGSAIADFDRAYPHNPRHTWCERISGGRRDAGMTREEAMWEDLDAAASRHPKVSWVYAWRGRMRIDGKPDQLGLAHDDLERAVRLDAGNDWAYAWRGFAKEKSKDARGAVADYSAAIRLNPGNGTAYAFRGILKTSEGDISGALRDFDRALTAGFHRGLALSWRGRLRWISGRRKSAARDLSDAGWHLKFLPSAKPGEHNRGVGRFIDV